MFTKRIIPPSDLPVSILRARVHMRNPENVDDGELYRFIRSAVEQVELKTALALMTQTWEAYVDTIPSTNIIGLAPSPVQSVAFINDANGVAFPMTNYIVDTYAAHVRLAESSSWPNDYPITVRWVAGYADPSDLPENVLHWICGFVEASDKQRSLLEDGKSPQVSPFIDHLLDRWRVYHI